jgi:hypothetical protein
MRRDPEAREIELRAQILENITSGELDEYLSLVALPTTTDLAREEAVRKVLQSLVSQFARPIRSRIVNKVVRQLRKQPSMIHLNSAWDDICVQVQAVESLYWENYLDTVDGFVHSEVSALLPYELKAVWLESEEGEEWAYGVDALDYEHIPAAEYQVVRHVVAETLSLAGRYTNASIRSYFE